jgi:hypothetical protein
MSKTKIDRTNRQVIKIPFARLPLWTLRSDGARDCRAIQKDQLSMGKVFSARLSVCDIIVMKAQGVRRPRFSNGELCLHVGPEEYIFLIRSGFLLDRHGAMEKARSLRSLAAELNRAPSDRPTVTGGPSEPNPIPVPTPAEASCDEIDDYGTDW